MELGSTGSVNTDGGSAVGTNNVIARVITGAASCPTITLNGGSPQAMNRARRRRHEPAPADDQHVARRAVLEAFGLPGPDLRAHAPRRHHERRRSNAALPGGSQGITLPLPKANAQTIVVLGDTGCRTQYGAGGTSQWQACNDPTQYAFGTIAAAAAAPPPGPGHPRRRLRVPRQRVPAGHRGLRRRPVGLRVGRVAGRLLQARRSRSSRRRRGSSTAATTSRARAPARAGSASSTRTATTASRTMTATSRAHAAAAGGGFVGDNVGGYNTPYAVQVRSDTQVIVFDTNNIAKTRHRADRGERQHVQRVPDRAAAGRRADAVEHVQHLDEPPPAARALRGNPRDFARHRPPVGHAERLPEHALPARTSTWCSRDTRTCSRRSTSRRRSTDAGVPNDYPSTFVSGNAGDILDTDLPTPLPDGSTPAPAGKVPPQVANIAHSPDFGFLVMQYQPGDAANGATWLLTEYKTDGTTVRTHCTAQMTGRTSCEPGATSPDSSMKRRRAGAHAGRRRSLAVTAAVVTLTSALGACRSGEAARAMASDAAGIAPAAALDPGREGGAPATLVTVARPKASSKAARRARAQRSSSTRPCRPRPGRAARAATIRGARSQAITDRRLGVAAGSRPGHFARRNTPSVLYMQATCRRFTSPSRTTTTSIGRPSAGSRGAAAPIRSPSSYACRCSTPTR